METPQIEADRLLAEDQAARAAMRRGADLESAARAALAAIDRDARERARPYLDTLARLEAARPPRPLVLLADGWTDRGRAWLQAGAPLGEAFGLWDRSGTTAALGEPFGAPPFSRADQVRNALLAAFEPCADPLRRDLRDALEGAPDSVLETAGRMLKHG